MKPVAAHSDQPSFLEANKGKMTVILGVALLALALLITGGLLFKTNQVVAFGLMIGGGTVAVGSLVGSVVIYVRHQRLSKNSEFSVVPSQPAESSESEEIAVHKLTKAVDGASTGHQLSEEEQRELREKIGKEIQKYNAKVGQKGYEKTSVGFDKSERGYLLKLFLRSKLRDDAHFLIKVDEAGLFLVFPRHAHLLPGENENQFEKQRVWPLLACKVNHGDYLYFPCGLNDLLFSAIKITEFLSSDSLKEERAAYKELFGEELL